MTIHGRRMPSRDVVRSLILPKNGLPTMATRAPIPVTSARLFGARSIPTSELTFSARVTSRGAMSTRQVLVNANAYSETKPQPTRWGASAITCLLTASGRRDQLSLIAGVPLAQRNGRPGLRDQLLGQSGIPQQMSYDGGAERESIAGAAGAREPVEQRATVGGPPVDVPEPAGQGEGAPRRGSP